MGYTLLAFLRLSSNIRDHLAWRTLFKIWCDGVGEGGIFSFYEIARNRGWSFADVVLSAIEDPSFISSSYRTRITTGIRLIKDQLAKLFPEGGDLKYGDFNELAEGVGRAAELLISGPDEREKIMSELRRAIEAVNATSIGELLGATEIVTEDIEQEIEIDKVNILTMHKAKGLTAEAVIVMATEDEYIPGRAEGEAIGDERRLLYVSLTRARHYLFITYCDRRTGRQRHTGRTSGNRNRTLTRFLQDAPMRPQPGMEFIAQLLREGT